MPLPQREYREHRDYTFLFGLMTGTFVGAGLAIWLVPRAASELRHKLTESLDDIGGRASDQFQQASARVGETVDTITRKGQGVRDGVAEAVARGAREVERYATVVQTERR
jgi:gas vesicle protein